MSCFESDDVPNKLSPVQWILIRDLAQILSRNTLPAIIGSMNMHLKTVDDVEKHLDDLLDNLEVYHWPLREVLWRSLAFAQQTADW